MSNDGLSERDQTRKDTSYSPASEAETEAKQSEPVPPTIDPDVADKVTVAPGTGGPDDPGEVVVEEGDITLPRVGDVPTHAQDPASSKQENAGP